MENANSTNSLAIGELFKGNELFAQNLFQENVKHSPSCLSLNNLGVYYCQYGEIQRNGKIRSAQKRGLKCLIKASLLEKDWRNYASTATAFMEFDNTLCCYQLFSKAYNLHSDNKLLYNIGACLFRLGDFKKTISVFEMLCTEESIEDIVKEGGAHPYIVLAYCKNKLQENEECINYLQKYRDARNTEDRFDVFHLRFLCGNYEDALSESIDLLNEWYLTSSMLALLAECVIHVPSYNFAISETIPSTHKKLWKALKNNSLLRKSKICKYIYLPPIIPMYYFIT